MGVASIQHDVTGLPHSKVLHGRCRRLETATSSAQAWKQSLPHVCQGTRSVLPSRGKMLYSHSPPPTHLGSAVFHLHYNRPWCHPTTLQNLPSIELPASGRDCSWGWQMKWCPSLKIDQARMIQISEEAALTPQEWQNLAINSVHHKDKQRKKTHLATTATVATAIIPANDNNLCWPHHGLPIPCQLVPAPAINISLFCTQRK